MDLLDQLAEDFNQDTVLFVGSGASIQSGLPSWGELIDWLKDYTALLGGNIAPAESQLQKKDLLKAASALTFELDKLGKSLANFFNEYEKCSVFSNATPTEIHRLIVQLPTNSIISPNYDLLIEKVYGGYGRDIQVVHKGDGDAINNIMRGNLTGYLYKYHGCITNPERIVLDFKRYIEEIHSPSLDLDCIATLIRTKTIIFIGSGLEDHDFNHVRDYFIQKVKADKFELWAFMKNCRDDVDFYKHEFGINLIDYSGNGNDHSDLLNKLKELIEKINVVNERKSNDIKLAIPPFNELEEKVGFLRKTLIQASEKTIQLDEQILGFVSFFDGVDKGHLYQFMIEFKGNDEGVILSRVEFLINQELMKETDRYFLPLRANFAIEAAVLVEDGIIEFLMEREHG
jgi:hypothetical protein